MTGSPREETKKRGLTKNSKQPAGREGTSAEAVQPQSQHLSWAAPCPQACGYRPRPRLQQQPPLPARVPAGSSAISATENAAARPHPGRGRGGEEPGPGRTCSRPELPRGGGREFVRVALGEAQQVPFPLPESLLPPPIAPALSWPRP